jgi:NitT/TauT family transport system substrate-binding protein
MDNRDKKRPFYHNKDNDARIVGKSINIVRKVPIPKVQLMEKSPAEQPPTPQAGAAPPKKNNKMLIIGAVAVAAIVIVAAVAMALSTPAKSNAIYYLTVAPVNQKSQIDANLIDGGVSWEPYVSDSLVSESAHVMAWSNDIWPNHPCCVLAVKTPFLQNNPDLVARLVRADMDASEWISNALENPGSANYTALLSMGAAFSNRTTTVVAAAVAHTGYSYEMTPQVVDYFKLFTSEFINLGSLSNQTLNDRGYSNVSNFVNDFVNATVVEKAMTVTPSPTILGTVRLGYLNGDLHQFARVVAMNTSLWGGVTAFEKYGVQVTSPAPYPNGPGVMDGFATDTIDAGYLGAPPAILKRLNADTKITLVALANTEGSAIIAKAGINTAQDLAGKVLGSPGPGTIQDLMLRVYAERNGLIVKPKGT